MRGSHWFAIATTLIVGSAHAQAKPPAPEPARRDEVQKLRAEIAQLRDKLREADERHHAKTTRWKQQRSRALAEYREKWEAYQRGGGTSANPNSPPNSEANPQGNRATEEFVEAALRAYVFEQSLRTEILNRLFEIAVMGQSWRTLLEGLADHAQASGDVSADVLGLFEALRDKVQLARMLNRAENRQAMQRLLAELRAKYPPPAQGDPHQVAPTTTFGQVFETLRRLNEDSFRYASLRAAELVTEWDPEARLVRNEVRIAFSVHPSIPTAYARGFRDTFAAWVREGAPDHTVKQHELPANASHAVEALLAKAAAHLTAQDRSGCPNLAPFSEEQIGPLVCGEEYNGLILVELRATSTGFQALASWRVREDGNELAEADAFPDGGFALAPSDDESEGRLKGGEFALDALSQGTLYKGVRGVFTLLRDLDPAVVTKRVASQRLQPSHLTPARQASALSATLWAGAPWLMDTNRGNDAVGYLAGSLDVIGLVGGLIAGGIALGAHRAGSASDDAWMTAAVSCFGVTVGSKLLSTAGYAFLNRGGEHALAARGVR